VRESGLRAEEGDRGCYAEDDDSLTAENAHGVGAAESDGVDIRLRC
jgi:hypothetical protein